MDRLADDLAYNGSRQGKDSVLNYQTKTVVNLMRAL